MHKFPVIRLGNILRDFKDRLALLEPSHGMNYVRLFKDFITYAERDDILSTFTKAFHDNRNVDVMAWYQKISATSTWVDLPEDVFDRLSHQYMFIFYAAQPDRLDLRNFAALYFTGAHLEEKLWRLKKLTVFPFIFGMQHACDCILEALPESGSAELLSLFFDALPSIGKFLDEYAEDEERAERGEQAEREETDSSSDLLELVSAVAQGEDPTEKLAARSDDASEEREETALDEASEEAAPPSEPPAADEESPAPAPAPVPVALDDALTERMPASQPGDMLSRQPPPRCFACQPPRLKEMLEALWAMIGRAALVAELSADLRIDLEILALELGRKRPRKKRALAILDDIGRAFVPIQVRQLRDLLRTGPMARN